MAIYRCELSSGSRAKGQSAAAKFDYICRQEKYANHADRCLYVASHIPQEFAHAREFWHCADKHERANARLFQEFKLSLPIEFKNKLGPQIEMVEDFIAKAIGNHPYTYAIHEGKGHNPHAHVIFSERLMDGVERDKEIYFKRANTKNPELGGAQKDRRLKSVDFLCEARVQWENSVNEGLHRNATLLQKVMGNVPRVDHRSRRERGLEPALPAHLNKAIEDKIKHMEFESGSKENSRRHDKTSLKDAKDRIREQAISVRERFKGDFQELGRQAQHNDCRARERHREIKQSIGRAEQVQQDGLQSISRSLAERNQHSERLQEDFTRDHQHIGELLRRTQESCKLSQHGIEKEHHRPGEHSPAGSIQRPRKSRVSNQLTLRDFKLPEGKVESCLNRERRENPRMGQGIGDLAERVRSRTQSIGNGLRKAVERTKRGIKRVQNQFERCVKIASESLRRHGTALLSLADKVKGGISTQKPLKGFKTPQIDFWDNNLVPEKRVELAVGKSQKMIKPQRPPEYVCPVQEEKREIARSLERITQSFSRSQDVEEDRGMQRSISRW